MNSALAMEHSEDEQQCRYSNPVRKSRQLAIPTFCYSPFLITTSKADLVTLGPEKNITKNGQYFPPKVVRGYWIKYAVHFLNLNLSANPIYVSKSMFVAFFVSPVRQAHVFWLHENLCKSRQMEGVRSSKGRYFEYCKLQERRPLNSMYTPTANKSLRMRHKKMRKELIKSSFFSLERNKYSSLKPRTITRTSSSPTYQNLEINRAVDAGE